MTRVSNLVSLLLLGATCGFIFYDFTLVVLLALTESEDSLSAISDELEEDLSEFETDSFSRLVKLLDTCPSRC